MVFIPQRSSFLERMAVSMYHLLAALERRRDLQKVQVDPGPGLPWHCRQLIACLQPFTSHTRGLFG